MSLTLILILTAFLGAFVQGVAGFGFALIAMPVLAGVMSIYVAAPLVALATLTNNTVLGLYYRRSFDPAIVGQLLIGSVLGIPFGFWALEHVPTAWMLMALGAMIVAYGLYSLVGPNLPVLRSPSWRYGAGFAAGVLMGSYNLPGPPVVLYGNTQRWTQAIFKSNLTSFFWVNAVIVVLGHGLQNRISAATFQQFLIIVPSLFLGLVFGTFLSKFFNPVWFRRVVLGLLIVIGTRLFVLGVQS